MSANNPEKPNDGETVFSDSSPFIDGEDQTSDGVEDAKKTVQFDRSKFAEDNDTGGSSNEATMLANPTPQHLVPGYRVQSTLGEGGMGVVYKAVQESLDREVALKVMKPLVGDDSFVARFKREAMTGAKLNHPNIVTVFDYGVHEETVYLVLEFVKGRNCAELLDDMGKFPPETAAKIITGAARGLAHGHEAGIIHRDIKPANIMIVDVESGSHGSGMANKVIAKVADFGLARFNDHTPDHDLTVAGSIMGTPGYMAPEQALGKKVDFRADIYSLGTTFYCLLTGRKPFDGHTAVEVFHKKMNEKAVNPHDHVEGLPLGFVRVIDRMMARNLEDRYQSYDNLVHDLEALIEGREPQTHSLEDSAASIGTAQTPVKRKKARKLNNAHASGKNNRLLLMAGGGLALVAILIVAFNMSSNDDGPGQKDGDEQAAQEPEDGLKKSTVTPNPVKKDAEVVKDKGQANVGNTQKVDGEAALLKGLQSDLDAWTKHDLNTYLDLRHERKTWSESLAGIQSTAKETLARNFEKMAAKRFEELTRSMSAAWKSANYLELRRLDRAGPMLIEESNGTGPKEQYALLSKRAKASAAGRGDAESQAFQKAKESKSPLAVLAVLSEFEAKYAEFSPRLDEVAKLRARAESQAPELIIQLHPKDAEVEYGGEMLAADATGVLKSRFVVGNLEFEVKAKGHAPRKVSYEHKKLDETATVKVRLDAVPAVPLETVNRAYPLLAPHDKKTWTVRGLSFTWNTTGTQSGFVLESRKKTWQGAWRNLNPIISGAEKRLFQPNAKFGNGKAPSGWQIEMTVDQRNCRAAEIRQYFSAKAIAKNGTFRALVLGIDEQGVYAGIRRGLQLKVIERVKLEDEHHVKLAMSFHGDVIQFHFNDELFGADAGAKKPFAAIKAPWPITENQRWLGLGMRRGKAIFGEAEIRPMYPK